VVAPVRWATPGMDVACTGNPACAAAPTIHSVRTPPPCPPRAAMRMETGRGLEAVTGIGTQAVWSQPITRRRSDWRNRSHAPGFRTTRISWNEGHSTAA
jgi:hypothetical protein